MIMGKRKATSDKKIYESSINLFFRKYRCKDG